MGRRRYRKKKPVIKYFRVNQQIQAPQVKLIDPDQGLVGIVSREKALQKAQEKGLSLVEVSPKENPPVVKILDYGKFKYSLEKKKQKHKTKKNETKGIRLSLNMALHDLNTREKQAKKFIKNGNKLKLEMVLRGREMAHIRRAFEQINSFIERLRDVASVIQPTSKKGRRLTAMLQSV
jgi:translation initiation factor IF-3